MNKDTKLGTFQYLFMTITHKMHNGVNGKIEKVGLTGPQARMLGYIVEHEKDGLTQTDLEKPFDRRGASITSMLKSLEKKGFIIRKVDPEDERRKKIYSTEKASEAVKKVEGLFLESEDDITSNLSEEEKTELIRLLNKVIDNLD